MYRCIQQVCGSMFLLNKLAKTILDGFKTILSKSQRKPSQLQTDDEKEFVNLQFKKYLESENIK